MKCPSCNRETQMILFGTYGQCCPACRPVQIPQTCLLCGNRRGTRHEIDCRARKEQGEWVGGTTQLPPPPKL
jgi:hypothetical protein